MIIDILIIAIVLITIFKIEGKTFPYASIIFVCLYTIYIYTGTIMMNYDEYIIKDIYYEKLQLLVRLGFLAIVLAYFTVFFVYKRKKLEFHDFTDNTTQSKKYAFYSISIIVVFISSLYLFVIPTNPLFTMISNPSQLAFVRESVTTTFDNFGFYNKFFSFFLPMVWLVLLFQNKKIYIPLFILNMIILLSTGQKSPIVYLLFLLIIGLSLKNKKFNYKKNIFYLIILIISLLVLVVLQNWHLLSGLSLDSLQLAWNGLQRRIFYGGVLPLKQYIEYFPQIMDHYYFSPPEIVPAKLVYAFAYPDKGIIGTVNTVSLGNLYAAFGNLSVVFILFYLISLLVFSIDRILFNYMKNSFEYSAYVMFCLISVKMVITDWYTVIPSFLIHIFAFFGAIFLIEAFFYNFASAKKSFVFYARNKYIGVISILIFLYLFQGQIKGLLLG